MPTELGARDLRLNKRIAILCHGAVPRSGIPNGAQGVRAFGLQLGLQSAGFQCDIVTRESLVVSQMRRWNVSGMRSAKNWRVVPDNAIQKVLQTEYDVVMFLNWVALDAYEKTPNNILIYDFLSPSLIEHSYLVSKKVLAYRQRRKIALLKQSDVVIANGIGRAEYGQNYLHSHAVLSGLPDPISIRLALPWAAQSPPDTSRLRVFVGGFEQAWTKGLTVGDLQDFAASGEIDICAIGVGSHLHNPNDIGAGKALTHTLGITWHDVAPFEKYCSLNAGCHIALDVFEENKERRLSYSTRAITSISNGCPVITMGFTEIGRMVAETGAGWILDEFSVDGVRKMLLHLASHPEEVAERSRNTRNFWERYCDPEDQIKPLVRILMRNEEKHLRADPRPQDAEASRQISASVSLASCGTQEALLLPASTWEFFVRNAYATWRHLPLSTETKLTLKTAAFRAMPIVFKRIPAFKAWQDRNHIGDDLLLPPENKTSSSTGGALASLDHDLLLDAQGTRDDLAKAVPEVPKALPRVAIVIHAFYPDILGEILELVQLLPEQHKLFVTTTKSHDEEVRDQLVKSGREYMLRSLPNRGRDILPFLKMYSELSAEGFQYFVKVHTKKSPQRRNGEEWRRELLTKLLDKDAFEMALAVFNEDESLGMVGPAGHYISISAYFRVNKANVLSVGRQLGFSELDIRKEGFFGGTMFMARVEALEPIMRLNFTDTDFESESGQVDGTLAHCLERCFALSVVASGHRVASSNDLRTTAVANDEYSFARKRPKLMTAIGDRLRRSLL